LIALIFNARYRDQETGVRYQVPDFALIPLMEISSLLRTWIASPIFLIPDA
jgi:hypothetical protein